MGRKETRKKLQKKLQPERCPKYVEECQDSARLSKKRERAEGRTRRRVQRKAAGLAHFLDREVRHSAKTTEFPNMFDEWLRVMSFLGLPELVYLERTCKGMRALVRYWCLEASLAALRESDVDELQTADVQDVVAAIMPQTRFPLHTLQCHGRIAFAHHFSVVPGAIEPVYYLSASFTSFFFHHRVFQVKTVRFWSDDDSGQGVMEKVHVRIRAPGLNWSPFAVRCVTREQDQSTFSERADRWLLWEKHRMDKVFAALGPLAKILVMGNGDSVRQWEVASVILALECIDRRDVLSMLVDEASSSSSLSFCSTCSGSEEGYLAGRARRKDVKERLSTAYAIDFAKKAREGILCPGSDPRPFSEVLLACEEWACGNSWECPPTCTL